MPFEIPRELISEIQAITRKEANLPSYDPNGAVAALPSVEDAVSRLDPYPNYVRCKHCNGLLLNGVNSILCLFCGTHSDTRPSSVRFTSTLACRWFLSSLRLDGSEVVEVPSGEEAAKVGFRGQAAPSGKEMKVSEILDLEVRYKAPEAAERTPYHWRFRGGSKLGGVDLSLLENSKREEEEVKEEEEEVKDGWEADFQFAGASATGSEGKEFASFKDFPSSSSGIDLSEQLDSVLGSERKPKDGGIVASTTSVSDVDNNWFTGGDSLSSAGVGISGLSDEFSPVSHKVSSSLDVDLFGGSQWQSDNTIKDTGVKAVGVDEDAFDDWDDFTGSVSASKSGNDDVVGGINGAASSSGLGTGVKAVREDEDAFDDWDDFTGSVSASKSGNDDVVGGINGAASSSGLGTGVKAVREDEDAFDVWDDFTGSVSASKSGNDDVVGGINGAVSSSGPDTGGMDLFLGVSNSQDVEFGAFSQPDFFSRGLDNQTLVAGLDAMQPETSASEGIKGTSDNFERILGDDASNGDTKPKDDDVETIMSQMHDLSFMLATELSIPQKQDPFGSVSTD